MTKREMSSVFLYTSGAAVIPTMFILAIIFLVSATALLAKGKKLRINFCNNKVDD
jgi:hypothetical protein